MKKLLYKMIAPMMGIVRMLLGQSNFDLMLSSFVQDYTPVVSAATKHGPIRFFCSGRLPHYRAATLLQKEPETIRWLESFDEGDVMWDIGANVGVYTLYAANRGIQVVSFEPSASNFALLNKNLELNKLDDRVSAYCVAMHSATELNHFNLGSTEIGDAFNSFGNCLDWEGNPYSPTFRQAMVGFRADDFMEQFDVVLPNHIKIDVDGNEDQIVAGAGNLFASPNVKSVLVELDVRREDYCEGVFQALRDAGLSNIVKEPRPEGGDGTFDHVFNFVARRA